MAPEKKPDPAPAEKARKAGIRAKSDVLTQTALDALRNVRKEEMIRADPEDDVVVGNARRPTCWQHAPATFELLAAADKRLTRVARWAGIPGRKVSKLQAELVPDTHLLVLTPLRATDLTGYEVKRYSNSSVSVNLVDLLAPKNLQVETGYRELFDVAYVPEESALWPALVINLDVKKARKTESTKDKQAADEGTQTETTAKKTAAKAPAKPKQAAAAAAAAEAEAEADDDFDEDEDEEDEEDEEEE